MKPLGSLILALLVLVVVWGDTAGAIRPESRPEFALASPLLNGAVRKWFPARHSLCDVRRGPLSYSWPVRPFRTEHPIRAFFGDPRTVFRSAANGDLGSFSFHNGVDIAAPDGTPVYPVFSGLVVKAAPDEIVVASPILQRRFQYWHLVRAVRVGRRVQAYKTVLGTVQPGRGHVHLTEIDNGVVVNPLQPGHLMPYRKVTTPRVMTIYVRTLQGRALDLRQVSNTITIAANAYDTPPLPLPSPWAGVSLTPAILRWRLTDVHGRDVVPVQTPIDFSLTIPPRAEFDSVYDTGTYQNFPAVGDRYFYGARGEYVFNLTTSALNTRALPAGAYTLTVSALDTCGNLGSLTEKLDVARQPRLRPIASSVTSLLPGAPWPPRFWTVVLAQAGAQTQALRDAVFTRERAVRADAVALITGRRGTVFGIEGAFSSWGAAYTEAQRVARVVPGAYVLDVHNVAPPPPRVIPMPGEALPA